MDFRKYKILFFSLLATTLVVIAKYFLHRHDLELLQLSSLHSSVVTGTFFVIGFLLSTTLSDYKESERIPSEFSSVIESMYEDAKSIHKNHPKFNLNEFRSRLSKIASTFAVDVRRKRHSTRLKIYELNDSFSEMETVGVPPNYVVKLKQQQAQLLRVLFRVTYIQKITFIPSARILAQSIVPIALALILFTEIEPFYGGLAIVAIISFILIYILRLIQVISTPFQTEGRTQDDVSLFLIDQTVKHLKNKK
jgi:hypothetical protein